MVGPCDCSCDSSEGTERARAMVSTRSAPSLGVNPIPGSRRRRRYGLFFDLTGQKVQTDMFTFMRASRLARGLTLKDIAKAVGLSESYIGHLEHGRQKPGAVVTERLARYFDTKPATLFEPVVLTIKKAR